MLAARCSLWFPLTLALACGGDKDSSSEGGEDGAPVDSGGGDGSDGADGTDGGGDTGSTAEDPDCDPTVPTACGMPFPSTYYMREDSSSETGWRVNLGATTIPVNANGVQPAPTYWNERDGWSVMTPAMTHFSSLSLDNINGHDDIGASLEEGADTLIVDVATGERVAHWGELDVSLGASDRSLLMLHPASHYEYGHRYVVAMRNLKDAEGAAIQPSSAFLALRDGTSASELVEGRRPVYDSVVFPAIEAAGWSRGEVQIAWDFVVGSKEGITGKARWMRDDALETIGEDGPDYTIDEVVMNPDSNIAFDVHGTMTVPLYTEEDDSGTVLTRDADGMPYQNGTTTVPFTVRVPQVLVEEARPGAILQYGHGLLGGQDEVEAGYLAEMANRYGWVLLAVDWTGMKSDDVDSITLMIVNEIEKFAMIPERSQQGLVEALCAMRLATGGLVHDPAFHVEDPSTGEMISLINPDERYYYGNSQGGIIGGAYMALSTDIERGVLGVPGTSYHLLLTRSADFDPFFLIFQAMYPDPADTSYIIALMQTLWDSGEAAGYAPTMNADPLEGTPAKQVLLQAGIGDKQVTTLGAQVMGRSYGARLIEEPYREVWGLETVPSGWEGSALVEWSYGLEEPYENVPPDYDQDPHESPRRELEAQEQLHTFLTTGQVIHYCDGPCQDLEEF